MSAAEGDGADDTDSGLLAVFRALAHGERLVVLRALRAVGDRGMNISQVAASAEVNRFAASRHLKALCRAGLVTSVRHNRSVVHRLDSRGFDRVEDWLYETAPAVDARNAVSHLQPVGAAPMRWAGSTRADPMERRSTTREESGHDRIH